MSWTIYLLRHGIAGDAPAGMSDADRSLTNEGKRKMGKIAAGLKRLGVAPAEILASPLLRAQQTAELVRAALTPAGTVQMYPALAPGGDAAEVLRGLGRRQRDVMLVGHEPDLGQLASYLLSGSVQQVVLPLKKGGVVAIRVAGFPPRGGTLLWLLTPKQLRLISGRHSKSSQT